MTKLDRTYPEAATAWRSLVRANGPWAAGFLALLMAALPLASNMVPLALVGFCVAVILHHRTAFTPWQRSAWQSPFPWLALFFLLHVLGMAWTEDLDFGLFDLQIKAPLLVLPLIALFSPKLPRVARDAVLGIGVAANALAVLICLLSAFLRLTVGSEFSATQELFSSRFSYLVHPSYFAMYLCFSMATWMFTPVNRWLPAKQSVALLLVLAVGVVLSGSKMGWIMLVLLLPAGLALRWKDTLVRRALLGTLLVSSLGLASLIAVSPYARDRVEEAWRVAFTETVDDNSETSSAVRRLTWSAAQELTAQDPWRGTGTGDIKNELLRIYGERGQLWAQEHRLNAHSQFLQSAACLGIPGVALLLLVLLAPFFSPSRKHALAVFFLLSCALNWSVESMLEVQAGVVWTALLAYVLFRSSSDQALLSEP